MELFLLIFMLLIGLVFGVNQGFTLFNTILGLIG